MMALMLLTMKHAIPVKTIIQAYRNNLLFQFHILLQVFWIEITKSTPASLSRHWCIIMGYLNSLQIIHPEQGSQNKAQLNNLDGFNTNTTATAC